MICENCNKEHDGLYGSGRFCCNKCAKGFSTKNKRQEINQKVKNTMKGNRYGNFTSESYKKISEANKGKKLSDETKQKISIANKGKIYSEETKKKISENLKGKIGGYVQGGGRGKRGRYNGIWCDSSWELVFVIYNLEHNIKFERNTQKFEYEYNGKHNYTPDFIMEDNTYIEIKGYETKIDKAKYNSFPYKLQVLRWTEIKPMIKYVEEKYGKDFIKLYD